MVNQQYSEDFVRFGYDPNGLPDLEVTRLRVRVLSRNDALQYFIYKLGLVGIRLVSHINLSAHASLHKR